MSIFPPRITEQFTGTITEKSLADLESLLILECKEIGIPYTRAYLKATVYAVRRFLKIGVIDQGNQSFTESQIRWVLHLEELLRRFEEKVAGSMPKDENIL